MCFFNQCSATPLLHSWGLTIAAMFDWDEVPENLGGPNKAALEVEAEVLDMGNGYGAKLGQKFTLNTFVSLSISLFRYLWREFSGTLSQQGLVFTLFSPSSQKHASAFLRL